MHVVIVSSPKFKMDDVNIVVPGLLNVFVHTVDISVILYSERTSTQLYTLYVNRDTERERVFHAWTEGIVSRSGRATTQH